MRQQQRMVLALVGVVLNACKVVEPSGCDICTTSAVVYGQVRDAAGVPVVGAVVHVDAYYADPGRGWGDAVVGSTNVTPRTDAQGRFRDQPLALVSPFRARLVVRVTPPASAGLSDAVATGAQVEFRDDFRGPARDSVRVDIVVPRGVVP